MSDKRQRLLARKRYYQTLASMLKWETKIIGSHQRYEESVYNGYTIQRKSLFSHTQLYYHEITGISPTRKGFKIKRYSHLWRVLEYIDNVK